MLWIGTWHLSTYFCSPLVKAASHLIGLLRQNDSQVLLFANVIAQFAAPTGTLLRGSIAAIKLDTNRSIDCKALASD